MWHLNKWVRGFLYGGRGQSGAVLAEFAVVAPILVMLLVGVAGLGSYFIQVEKLNSALEAGLLYVTAKGWDKQKISEAITSNSSAATPDATCFYGCPTATGIDSVGALCGQTPPANCQGYTKSQDAPGQYVQITATAPVTNVVPGFASLFGVALPTSISLKATTRAK